MTVPEEVVVSAVLIGIGSRFGTLVTVVTHGSMPTLDSLSALLLNKEAKTGVVSEGTLREGAYLARGHLARAAVCWHCQKPGHKQDKCWELHPELRRSASTGPLPTPGSKGNLSPEGARTAVVYTGEAVW